MFTRTLAGAGALTLTAVTVLLAGTTQAQTRYTVVPLNTGFNSTPTGITNTGLIAGNYQNPAGQYRAFLWQEGVVQDLGSLGGTTQVGAINEQGVMAGLSVNSQNQQRAVRIDSSGITDLGGAAGATASVANDINALGWIVGNSMVPSGSSSAYRALLWRNGGMTALGSLVAGGQADARAVSDSGYVVGWATNAENRQRAFRWTESGGMIDLGSLYSIGWSFGLDVNIHGTVVGASLSQDGQRAFMWTPQSGMQALPIPAGFLEAWAFGINNAGQVVGYSTALGGDDCETIFEPTMWENGVAIRLNSLINGEGTLHSVLDINERGEIIGISTGGSAVLLVPVGNGGCTSDFNGDGDFGTDQDIESFFACLAGSCCAACPDNADFNGDGDIGTDQDIESFFRVLGGGNC
jgi:probable HAF family extracellular repeat protein